MNYLFRLSLIYIFVISCAPIPDASKDPCFQLPDYYLLDPIEDTSPIIEDVDEAASVDPGFRTRVRYPRPARASGIQGIVNSEITISKTGVVQEVKIVNGLGYCTDQEIVRILSSASYEPAMKDGEPVRSKLFVPFNFNLVDN